VLCEMNLVSVSAGSVVVCRLVVTAVCTVRQDSGTVGVCFCPQIRWVVPTDLGSLA
jgi:hypothetical protein